MPRSPAIFRALTHPRKRGLQSLPCLNRLTFDEQARNGSREAGLQRHFSSRDRDASLSGAAAIVAWLPRRDSAEFPRMQESSELSSPPPFFLAPTLQRGSKSRRSSVECPSPPGRHPDYPTAARCRSDSAALRDREFCSGRDPGVQIERLVRGSESTRRQSISARVSMGAATNVPRGSIAARATACEHWNRRYARARRRRGGSISGPRSIEPADPREGSGSAGEGIPLRQRPADQAVVDIHMSTPHDR